MTAVHQLLPVLSRRDAIGNTVVAMRQMLRALGYESEIYAGLADTGLGARPAPSLESEIGEGAHLIYHLAIGWPPLARAFAGWPAKRLLFYHNITPVEYYARLNARVAYTLRQGRVELAQLAPLADLVIAGSSFNAAEAAAAGAKGTRVIPLYAVTLRRLESRARNPSDPPLLLAVGRFAPNKRQDHLLRVMGALRRRLPGARLIVVGGSYDTEPYVDALRRLSAELGLQEAVEFRHDVDDRGLARLYAEASALLSPSQHEGFCIPLLEAMGFGLPVVALDAGAVGETLGGYGILLSGLDPLVWASVIERLLGDQGLQRAVTRPGPARLAEMADERLLEGLGRALGEAGIERPVSGAARAAAGRFA